MKNQLKSKTRNPVQDDKPRPQQGTSSKQASSSDSQIPGPQREISSQQSGPIFSPYPSAQPGTSSQQSGPFFSPHSAPQPGTSSQQSGPIFSPYPDPQPGTSSQQSGPIFSPHPSAEPGTSSQQDGPSDPQPPVQENTRRNPNWKVCPYNLLGTCRHGDHCWYSHNYCNSETNTDSNITRHSSTICPVHRVRLQSDDDPIPSGTPMDPSKWVRAPEFVPQAWKSLAEAIKSDSSIPNLCPSFVIHGMCPFSASVCPGLHGDTCELCQIPCLDPQDEAQRRAHTEQCERDLEKDMENSFAIHWSEGQVCGICHEVVWDKELSRERRFGVLENCNHVFCLACIRTWRTANRCPDDLDVTHPPMSTRQCPVCRKHSDYFVPSHVWVEGEEGKMNLFRSYREAVAKKPCRYFKEGSVCPIGEKCFYLHLGSVRNPDPPPRRLEEEVDHMEIWNDGDPPQRRREVDVMEEISTWNDGDPPPRRREVDVMEEISTWNDGDPPPRRQEVDVMGEISTWNDGDENVL